MLETIMAILAVEGYETFNRPYELNIIGVRSKDMTPNIFNDTINAIYADGRNWFIHPFKATTDPGLYWLRNPLNVDGTAILKAGQYLGSHCVGLHRGKYPALIQARSMTVIRDAKRDGSLDFSGDEQSGIWGINIHRAREIGTTLTVDKFSAGCQVFADANDFDTFMNLCQKHRSLYGNRFTYTLSNEPEYLKPAA